MLAMYWNCTSAGNANNVWAQRKLALIKARVGALKPDILCLDEVSGNITNVADAQTYADTYLKFTTAADGFDLQYTAKEMIANPGVHLNTLGFVKAGASPAPSAQAGLPSAKWDSDLTKRDLIRFQWTPTSGSVAAIYVWFLHANASAAGGSAAVSTALTAPKDWKIVFLGDFNYSSQKSADLAAAAKFRLLQPKLGACTFSQWKVDPYGSALVPASNPPVKYSPNAQGFIDFAIAGLTDDNLKVIPADTLSGLSAQDMHDLMLNFDHFPIAYNIA